MGKSAYFGKEKKRIKISALLFDDRMRLRIALREGVKCKYGEKTTSLEYYHIWMRQEIRLRVEHERALRKVFGEAFETVFNPEFLSRKGPTLEWNLVLLCREHQRKREPNELQKEEEINKPKTTDIHHPTSNFFTYQSYPTKKNEELIYEQDPERNTIYNLLYVYLRWIKEKLHFNFTDYQISLEKGKILLDGNEFLTIYRAG